MLNELEQLPIMSYSTGKMNIEPAETWDSNGQAPSGGLFRWKGRIGRLEYFWTIFLTSLVIMGLAGILTMAENQGATNGIWLFNFLLFPIIYISFSAGIKRCHDLGKSGWLYLAVAIPLVNIVLGLYLLFAKGMRGPNQYGPHPSNVEVAPIDSSTAKTKTTSTSISRNSEPYSSTTTNFSDNSSNIRDMATSGFDEEAAYTEIARELDSKSMDQGMWLKAMVQAGSGEQRQQTIVYTSLRLQKLRELFLAAKTSNETLRVAEPSLSSSLYLPEELQHYLQVCGGNCPNCHRLIPDASHKCTYCTAEFGQGSTWKILKFPFEGQIQCLKRCFSKGLPLKVEELKILIHSAHCDETFLSLYNDVTWDTLLHVCVRLELVNEVRSLVTLGASLDAQNAKRQKPRDLAETVEMTNLLQESVKANGSVQSRLQKYDAKTEGP